jgi:hypothetical protein
VGGWTTVLPQDQLPDGVEAERDWVLFTLQGPFPFELTGILSSVLGPLAAAQVPIFAVSTFETDHVLVPARLREAALAALAAAGHTVLSD